MIEVTRKHTGMAKKVDSVSDLVAVLEWMIGQDGLYCTVSARCDNEWLIEVGGTEVASTSVELGQWLVFDGEHFAALDDAEFKAKGYSSK